MCALEGIFGRRKPLSRSRAGEEVPETTVSAVAGRGEQIVVVYDINRFMISRTADAAITVERLKYVTEHFGALQGLRSVLVGAFLLLLPIEDLYWGSWPLRGWLFLFVLAALLATACYVPQYYRRRFGWVESRGSTNWQSVVFLSLCFLLLLFGRPLGRYADSIIGHVQSTIRYPAFPFTFPVLFWFALLCTNVRRHPQQEDRYRIYFFSLGTLCWALVALYALRRPDIMLIMFWKTLNACWIGISLIAIGLHDHMTLVRLLPKRTPEADNGRIDND